MIIGTKYIKDQHGEDQHGSHNLVIVDTNSFSAYGGIVAGYGNDIPEGYASVTCGVLTYC